MFSEVHSYKARHRLQIQWFTAFCSHTNIITVLLTIISYNFDTHSWLTIAKINCISSYNIDIHTINLYINIFTYNVNNIHNT